MTCSCFLFAQGLDRVSSQTVCWLCLIQKELGMEQLLRLQVSARDLTNTPAPEGCRYLQVLHDTLGNQAHTNPRGPTCARAVTSAHSTAHHNLRYRHITLGPTPTMYSMYLELFGDQVGLYVRTVVAIYYATVAAELRLLK
jgi:hypothetical protein